MMQDITAATVGSTSNEKTTGLQLPEESPECPYCFETMIKIYDWDKLRYLCEDCDSIFSRIFYEDGLN